MKKINALAYNGLVRLDNLIRHRDILGRHLWLRNILRKTYHRVINIHDQGIPIRIGGCIDTQLPPEFSSKLMEKYEVEAMRAIKKWLNRHGSPIVVDVGCSVGYVSCACLFENASADVISIDGDLNSLKSLLRVCRYAPNCGGGVRLFPVWGLLSKTCGNNLDYKSLCIDTRDRLGVCDVSGDPGTHTYVNLDAGNAAAIPMYSLDGLLRLDTVIPRDILVKIDVEGAEYEVLQGARAILARRNVTWSVSIHPELLKRFNHTDQDVHSLMRDMGYKSQLLARDHEEHWWYEPLPALGS